MVYTGVMVLLALFACVRPQAANVQDIVAAPPPVAVPGSEMAFYEVTGRTPVDVVESMTENAPQDSSIHHAAQTDWDVVWRYPAGPDDGSAPACQLDQVDVHVSILTRFPHWQPPADADPKDVDEWARYTTALAKHESAHVRIIDDLAGTLPAALNAGTCDDADQRGEAVLDAIRAQNAELDTDTLDGETTGAELAWVAPFGG